MSHIARTAFVVIGVSAAAIGAASIITNRQTDMGRAAARAAMVIPLAERARAAFDSDPALGPFPAGGTRAWIEGPDGTIVARDLPSAAFALESGQSLDPRIPPGPFSAVLEVTFRPRGDALGQVGASLTGLRMILEQVGVRDALQVDAAAARTRESLTSEPKWMRTPVERLDYSLTRSRGGGASFRAIREPFDRARPRPLPSAGRPVLALGPGGSPAAPLEAWPPADAVFPIDALIGGLDLGRCTDCHAFHARRPLTGTSGAATGAADLAAAALRQSILELAGGMVDCDDRGRAIGLDIPALEPPDAMALATLLIQSVGRLPSAEATAAADAVAEAERLAAEAATAPPSASAPDAADGPDAPDRPQTPGTPETPRP